MFEIGQKVWDFTKGWGVVEMFDEGEYPILVRIGIQCLRYTQEGKYFSTDINPTLFHYSFEIPEKKTETRVKSRDAITRWCLEHGYEVSAGGALFNNWRVTFNWVMFEYCGKIKPNRYKWLPEWLEEVEVI